MSDENEKKEGNPADVANEAKGESRDALIAKHGYHLGRDICIVTMNLLLLYYLRTHGHDDDFYFWFFSVFSVFYAVGAYKAFCELARLIRGEDLEEERRRKWREATGVGG